MRIDSHQHFWKYHPVKDAWITDEMKVIQRDFMPEDLRPVLGENDIDGCVAVQADQSEAETNFLLQCADENDFIKGVVGWIDLRADDLEDKLHSCLLNKKLKGFRHIVQAEPDGFLLQGKFIEGVKLLHQFEYTYDILIHNRQLKETLQFINKLPAQKLIIDHCAKPCIRNKEITDWSAGIKEIAANENVYCKVSGLITEADWYQWNEKNIYPYLDIVFDAFGEKRILFGSDWPVILLAGNYSRWITVVNNYFKNFNEEIKQRFWGQNAIEFYSL
ncbi:MAG: amidohydrolase family protein [Sphingobacteriales bacterium]|nr:amidohydrolase family protein [Sphingobacteriales bacterium]MBI3719156.1 amidohydrolase family protein [Sphingobacteriales bacterium]